MRKIVILLAAVYILFLPYSALSQTVKRGRDEGPTGIPASNVMGNGNISLFIESIARYSLNRSGYDPILGGKIGISDIVQLTGQFVPIAKKGIGPVEAHLHITLPGNDNLRFFGAALRADLFLSSTQDTLGATSQADKPEYNPYLFPSLTLDLDWLALFKFLPMKTYVFMGMVDNIDYLPLYDQLSLRFAVEWKMYRHSVFVGLGTGLYREKRNKTTPGDAGYAQGYFWIEPGARFRLRGRFCIIGSTKLTLFQNVKTRNPLKPELFNASIKFEVPIVFKETNAEVIRTLIFMEGKKEKKLNEFEKRIATGKSLVDTLDASLLETSDSSGTAYFPEEKDSMKKKREETQKKMDEIERLFLLLNSEEHEKGKP